MNSNVIFLITVMFVKLSSKQFSKEKQSYRTYTRILKCQRTATQHRLMYRALTDWIIVNPGGEVKKNMNKNKNGRQFNKNLFLSD